MTSGLTIVISPLLALMKDQEHNLRRRGIAARRLDSSLSSEEVSVVLQELQDQTLKILFVSPERFSQAPFLRRLKSQALSLVSIDEAHCISEWGHTFRPDYLKIAQALKKLPPSPVLALTATATPRVSRDICKSFRIDSMNHIQTGFHRPHLALSIQQVTQESRDEVLLSHLRSHPNEPTIIYVTRQMTTEFLTTYLKRQGISQVRSYHAGMGIQKRQEIQEEFMSGRCQIIVATIAFGMGIDKADIRYVYHYNLPKSFENYIQETGRAGRDRNPARGVMLACADDFRVLENFIYARRPSSHSIAELSFMCLGADHVLLNRYEVSTSLDIKQEVIESILVFLELKGFIKPLGKRFDEYTITLLQPLHKVFQGRSKKQRSLLELLFTESTRSPKKHTNYLCNISDFTLEYSVSEKQLIALLKELEAMGEVALKPRKFLCMHKLTKKGQQTTPVALKHLIEEYFTQQEERELLRLENISDLIHHSACIEQTLLRYFGDETPPCNQCSHCVGERPAEDLLRTSADTLTQLEIESLHTLYRQKHASLSSALQLTKFLCGITSPATTRARLTTTHDLFGALAHHSFQEVLSHCEALVT